jgi:hypothetical protein
MGGPIHDEETSMSMQGEGKDAKGRNYDQATRDGSSSAASMGTGGTGDIGSMGGQGGGSRQSDSRTDDLLAGETTGQEADKAFSGGSKDGQIQTGMEGIAERGGNRQSGQQGGSQQKAPPGGQAAGDQVDQGSAPRDR